MIRYTYPQQHETEKSSRFSLFSSDVFAAGNIQN